MEVNIISMFTRCSLCGINESASNLLNTHCDDNHYYCKHCVEREFLHNNDPYFQSICCICNQILPQQLNFNKFIVATSNLNVNNQQDPDKDNKKCKDKHDHSQINNSIDTNKTFETKTKQNYRLYPCSNNEKCYWRGPQSSLQDHEQNHCPWKQIDCNYVKYGCTKGKNIPIVASNLHNWIHMESHVNLRVLCFVCVLIFLQLN